MENTFNRPKHLQVKKIFLGNKFSLNQIQNQNENGKKKPDIYIYIYIYNFNGPGPSHLF